MFKIPCYLKTKIFLNGSVQKIAANSLNGLWDKALTLQKKPNIRENGNSCLQYSVKYLKSFGRKHNWKNNCPGESVR